MISKYNTYRPHHSFGELTPLEYTNQYLMSQQYHWKLVKKAAKLSINLGAGLNIRFTELLMQMTPDAIGSALGPLLEQGELHQMLTLIYEIRQLQLGIIGEYRMICGNPENDAANAPLAIVEPFVLEQALITAIPDHQQEFDTIIPTIMSL